MNDSSIANPGVWIGPGHHYRFAGEPDPQLAMCEAETLAAVSIQLAQLLEAAANAGQGKRASMIAGEWNAAINRADESLSRALENSPWPQATDQRGTQISAGDYNAASLQIIEARRAMRTTVQNNIAVMRASDQADAADERHLRREGRDAALAAWSAAAEYSIAQTLDASRSPAKRDGHRRHADRLGTALRDLIHQGDDRKFYHRRGRAETRSMERTAERILQNLKEATNSSEWNS